LVDSPIDDTVELESLADVGRGSVRMMMGTMVVLLEEELVVLSFNRDLPCEGYRGGFVSPKEDEEVAWVL
jgi:hypothetical protein